MLFLNSFGFPLQEEHVAVEIGHIEIAQADSDQLIST
jgi:hypothetical protein